MGKVEFVASQKFLRSPFMAAYDQDGRGVRRSSILIPRKVFETKKVPINVKVTVEWE